MAEISNSKTWTKIYRTFASGAGSDKTVIRTIKNDLITAGFSHVSSCDSAAVSSSTDLWDSDSDIVWSATTNHSWIVLSHSGIVSGLQICIDLNYASNYITAWASMSSGFSNGTISSRPIASDEIKISEGTSCGWGTPGESYSRQYNLFYCTDSVRIYTAHSSTSSYGFWHFDKIQNAPTWLTYPAVLKIGDVSLSALKRSSFVNSSGFSYCSVNGKQILVNFGSLCLASTAVQDLTSLNSGDYNSEWPTSKVIVVSNSISVPGIYGYLADMWQVVDDLADFDYFPGDGSKAQFVLQDIAQGSDGSTISW
jgi:hypothetical protein